jgi:hypothetical protein
VHFYLINTHTSNPSINLCCRSLLVARSAICLKRLAFISAPLLVDKIWRLFCLWEFTTHRLESESPISHFHHWKAPAPPHKQSLVDRSS